jgi:hypothetical protein
MQAFKPKKKPFWENPVLQIAVIVLIAAFLIKNILGNSATKMPGKRTVFSQGFTRSEKRAGSSDESAESESAFASSSEQQPKNAPAANTAGAAPAAPKAASGPVLVDPDIATFTVHYAEISNELANKWTVESNNAGFFQSLPDYSVGILHNASEKREDYKQHLKEADIKVRLESSGVNLSGVMSDDGSQLIGLATSVELKSMEGRSMQGNIVVTKNSREGTEVYPAEFDLPRGSMLFILGALKSENFAAERSQLQMPPFNILKSPDFMTQKTQFVIILKPVYR